MRPIVILDRDGTVNVERHYLSSPAQLELLDGAAAGIRMLRELGLPVVLITNQSGIARGFFSLDTLELIHAELRMQLSAEGAGVDAIYFCPHSPSDDCQCRKPRPGLALKAAQEFGASLTQSFVIGDKSCDMELGDQIGAHTILVTTGYGKQERQNGNAHRHISANLLEAARKIKQILFEQTQNNVGATMITAATSTAGGHYDVREVIRKHLVSSAQVKHSASASCVESIASAAKIITDCFKAKGKVLLCGNGGSAADCQHIAAEFISVLRQEFPRPGLPAIALTTDSSILTARGNDFGFDQVFSRQIQALGMSGDVLIAISTSGNSQNVLNAVQQANALGMHTIAFTGGTGGKLVQLSQVSIIAPSDVVQHIQETHIAAAHALCQVVEESIFKGPFS
jgi:phosphoheptose isomerase